MLRVIFAWYLLYQWETTRNLPTAESLDRLCTLLHAVPEEKQALQACRLQRMYWKPLLTDYLQPTSQSKLDSLIVRLA